MAVWNLITNYILDLIDYGDDDRPTYFKVTKESKKYFGIGRTLLRDLSSFGLSDDIWVDEELGNPIYTLFSVFHECWHALQKKKNPNRLKYTDEDRAKYLNHNQMMLYKYDFEAEATGYAAAFVYYMYKINSLNKKWNYGVISDSYDNVDSFPVDQFDSQQDFVDINKKIESFYLKGKEYFEELLGDVTTQLSDVVGDIDAVDKKKVEELNELYIQMKRANSPKGLLFSRINKYL